MVRAGRRGVWGFVREPMVEWDIEFPGDRRLTGYCIFARHPAASQFPLTIFLSCDGKPCSRLVGAGIPVAPHRLIID